MKNSKNKVKSFFNKFRKSKVEKTVAAIVIGAKDFSGNTVANVLAKHNEYVIYEIETDDINNRIKVLISGHNDKSEKIIQDRFNNVKQKYIEAKGMLSKSSNFEMMKHRVAHTLSTALSSNELDGKSEFDDLINTITKEHEELVVNRAIYLSPPIISVVFFFLLALFLKDLRIEASASWQISISFLAASLGGAISIIVNAKHLNFEEFKTKLHYALLGFERVSLAWIAGAVAFIALKSGFISPKLATDGYWSLMLIIVFSGFSESFIPRFLSKEFKIQNLK